MRPLHQARVTSRLWLGPVLALTLCVSGGVAIQPAAVTAIANQSPTTMNTFVLIFRQGPRTLTDTEIKQRALDTSAWARRTNEAGHKLAPHILRPERQVRGANSDAMERANQWPVTALLFLEARDLDDAAAVADAHPALRYGANIEVRPWAAPAPVAP